MQIDEISSCFNLLGAPDACNCTVTIKLWDKLLVCIQRSTWQFKYLRPYWTATAFSNFPSFSHILSWKTLSRLDEFKQKHKMLKGPSQGCKELQECLNVFHYFLFCGKDTFQIKCYNLITSGVYPVLSAFLHCLLKYGPNLCGVIWLMNLIYVLKMQSILQTLCSSLFEYIIPNCCCCCFLYLLFVSVVCHDTFGCCYSAMQA